MVAVRLERRDSLPTGAIVATFSSSPCPVPRLRVFGAPSVSIGIIQAASATPVATLIARADQAMYMVKADRRKPVTVYKAA
jgi:GGDEF domain-containing protein